LTTVSQSAGTEFCIRDYRPADFEVLWRIDQLCFPIGISYSKIELSSFLTRRHAIALVAEFEHGNTPASVSSSNDGDDRIAGFVIAHSIRHKYGRILTLDILPDARRFGLGTKLMLACEERLRSAGCREVFLETAVNNDAALRLYGKLGYQVLRTLPDYYSSHSLDAFQMGKVL
jgi:[ribosomal protein S18]-alanine N-acetyltransferase